MVDGTTERRLLENVLDALDDLYDRRERAEWWVERLLLATSVALRGTPWENPMETAAGAIGAIRSRGSGHDLQNAEALAATDDLRVALARTL